MNRQLKLLQVPHSSFYYKRLREISRTASDERVKDEMMEIYMETPFYGVPRLTAELKRRGYRVNHKRVRRLQKCLNLRTVYPRPRFNTSEPHPGHEKFPYLLRKCKIERPNQVWSTDITYTAVAGHRAFVIGIVDWFSRKVPPHSRRTANESSSRKSSEAKRSFPARSNSSGCRPPPVKFCSKGTSFSAFRTGENGTGPDSASASAFCPTPANR